MTQESRIKVRMKIGFLVFIAGVLILILNSEIQDIGLAIISIGGLFTIWFKLGCLESETKELSRRINELEKAQSRITEHILSECEKYAK